MKVPIEQLGEFRSGFVARVGLGDCGGSHLVRALQARDIASDRTISWAGLRCVKEPPAAERYRIRNGDLLIPLRTTRVTAVVTHGVPEGVIAVGHWGLLTVDPATANAGYLAWYLNHPSTWPRLQSIMSGSSMPFLSMGALRAFEIEVVPLKLQQSIARAAAAHAYIGELEAKLAAARRSLVDHLTMAALRERHGHVTENT